MAYSDREVVERFFEVYVLNRRYSEKKYGQYTPDRGQLRCLLTLDQHQELSQKDLASFLHIRSTSTGELIAKLEKKGFLKKRVSREDKRKSLISLTDLGKEEVRVMKAKRSDAHQDMLTDLTREEKEQFADILGKIESYYKKMEATVFESNN